VPGKGLLQNQQGPGGAALAFCTGHGTLLCPLSAGFRQAAAPTSHPAPSSPVVGTEGGAGGQDATLWIAEGRPRGTGTLSSLPGRLCSSAGLRGRAVPGSPWLETNLRSASRLACPEQQRLEEVAGVWNAFWGG